MITNTANKVIYTGDGNTKQFLIEFPFGDISEINLFLHNISTGEDEAILSNWSYDNATGYITYPVSGSAMASTHQIVVIRQTPLTQEKDHTVRLFTSEDIETISDKLTREVQDISEKVDRSIKFPASISSGETDAKKYIDDLTELKDIATTQAGIATQKAGEASTSATNAATSESNAEKWAEGTDAQVEALGGTHSAKNWAAVAQSAAESEAVQTVAANIEDVQTVAGIQSDVTQVASIATAVSTVSAHDTEINTVYDNLSSVITTATNINDVNAVAGIKNDVVAVSNIKANVTSVAGNASNINAVAANATNINTVAADKTNIDAVAGNATNINTVATNISDVTSVATAIADVSAVADDLTDISAVADDLTNIDAVAASLSDIQDKQNKVLTNSVILGGETQTTVEGALEAISEDWVKPADWVDIRSGALNNSIYVLVGHAADFSKYAKFSFVANTSTSGNTYDVYVDGIKQTTTVSGTPTTLDWQTLALDSGYDVTYPAALRTHIVRITPTQSTDTLTRYRIYAISGQRDQGLLWLHFELSNPIKIDSLCATETDIKNFLLQAVTAKNDNITYTVSRYTSNSGFYCAFRSCTSLKKIPVLTAESTQYASGTYLSFVDVPLKKVIIKNNSGREELRLINSAKTQEFDIENGVILSSTSSWPADAHGAVNLKKLPPINASDAATFQAHGLTSLQDTFVDDSSNSSRKLFRFYGTGAEPVRGLKGLVVSNEAPFDGESPQINVAYTGLDRAALINLFKSMPYNVGYEVVGSPTIVDGVVSGFSANNYLRLNQIFSISEGIDFEIFTKIKTPQEIANEKYEGDIFSIGYDGKGYGSSLRINNSNKLYFGFYKLGSFETANTLSLDTEYYIKAGRSEGVTYLAYSTDNINWTIKKGTYSGEQMNSAISGDVLPSFGRAQQFSSSRHWQGSIDLNNTYIKVNGVPWFTGKAAMTKTCSVVGCTGTADLTQEDKNIALDKGWELTVA